MKQRPTTPSVHQGHEARSEASASSPSPTHHSAWLDWLRFFASIEVVFTHARTTMFAPYSDLASSSQNAFSLAFVGLTRSGYEAVMVFFVLSGFLVGGRALDLARVGQFSLATYTIDRVVRILVPLSGAIVLTVIVANFIGTPIAALDVAGNFLSLQGVFVDPLAVNYALWTLSYEVWFYLVGGAVAAMISARRLMLVPVLIVLAGAFVFTRLNPLFALLWIGGAACYFYRPTRIVRWHVVVAALTVLAGFGFFQLSLPRGADEIGIPLGRVFAGALILAGLVFILPIARAAKAPAARLAPFLASFSYSLYLVHNPLLHLAPWSKQREISLTTMTQFVVVILAILLFAFVFSRCFETTGTAIKALLRKDSRTVPIAA